MKRKMRFFQSLLLLLLRAAASFVIQPTQRLSSLIESSKSQEQEQTEAKAEQRHHPVFVVGGDETYATAAALGADLALGVLDNLDGHADESRPMTSYLTHVDDPASVLYEYLLEEHEPILHVVMEDESLSWLSSPKIRDNISFLGLHATHDDQENDAVQSKLISPDVAQRLGMTLKEVMDEFSDPDGGPPNVAMSIDLALHLSLLQANALPKSSAHGDTFQVLNEENGSIHIEYLYDYSIPGPGTDPLSCATNELTIYAGQATTTQASKHASAAAYSTLRGNGIDGLSAASIAASIATVLLKDDDSATSVSLAEQITRLSRKVYKKGMVPAKGIMVQRYVDFGYK